MSRSLSNAVRRLRSGEKEDLAKLNLTDSQHKADGEPPKKKAKRTIRSAKIVVAAQ